MVSFEVIYTQWSSGDDVFGGGVHEVAKPSAELLRHLAAAEATGDVRILEASDQHRAKMDRHVQSQEDGEAALAKAMGDWDEDAGRWSGPWHDGNLANFELDVDAGVRSRDL